MRVRTFAFWGLAAAIAAAPVAIRAIQDDAPLVHPKQPPPKPAGATLLVLCDLACNWKLDGEPKGRIEAGASAKVKVELGQHVVVAVTEDGADQVRQIVEVKSTGQTAATIDLQPVRDARLKSEKEAKDKADQESREKAAHEQEAKDKAAEEARVKAAREQEARDKIAQEARDKAAQEDAARLQDLRDHAVENFNAGQALYDQKRYDEAKPLLEKACEGGNLLGCDNLAGLYDNGWGVTQDFPKARTLWQKACDGGEMNACNNLAFRYQMGRGVAQDYAQARTLYQKACDGGIQLACKNLHNLP